MNRFKELTSIISGILGFCVTMSFGVWLLNQSDAQGINIASWVMWTLLDGIALALAWKASTETPYMLIGWTAAATIVTTGILWKGATWQIGFAEITSAVAVVIATYLWWTNKWGMGLIACSLAMFVAGIPQVMNFWDTPAQATWWLWVGIAISGTLSIVGSENRKGLQNAPAYSSVLYQLLVLLVLFR